MMISGALASVPPMNPLPAARAADDDRNFETTAETNDRDRTQERRRSEPENPQGLEDAELQILADLKARDREVRAHEAAHQAVGGQYAGSISYVYQRGPDGAQYAVGGEVSIDTSPIHGDAQATIEKMRTVRAAALAPAEPSSQDRAVAAEAMQLMLQARSELFSEPANPEDTDPAGSGEDDKSFGQETRSAASAYQTVSGLGETDTVNNEVTSRFKTTA